MLRITGNAKDGPPIIRVALVPVLPTPQTLSPSSDPLQFTSVDCRALLDTGADGTSVSRPAAEAANLIRRSKVLATGIGGQNYVRSWTTYLGVYGENPPTSMPFIFDEPLLAVEMRPYSTFEVIIGRDLLLKGTFTLRPNGDFEWALPTSELR